MYVFANGACRLEDCKICNTDEEMLDYAIAKIPLADKITYCSEWYMRNNPMGATYIQADLFHYFDSRDGEAQEIIEDFYNSVIRDMYEDMVTENEGHLEFRTPVHEHIYDIVWMEQSEWDYIEATAKES